MFEHPMFKRSVNDPVKPDIAAMASGNDETAKQAALAQAEALRGDEAGAVTFILQCGYADARLRAAEHVHERTLMEQVLQAMRKLDRRVSKLMQMRIDAIVKREMIARHAQECIADARRLLKERPLVPNRVADIDRNWRSVGEADDRLQEEFAALRREMDDRLAAQTALQRSAIDLLDGLRKLSQLSGVAAAGETAEALDDLARKMAECRAMPDAGSLPRSLLAEFDQMVEQLRRKLVVAEQEPTPSPQMKPDEVTQEQPPVRAAEKIRPDQDKLAEWRSKMDEALEAMEMALQAGTLHLAARQDALVQALAAKIGRVGDARMARWNQLRTDLKRLQGWARWSGKVSREELIKEVASLPERNLPLGDLARAVAASRERWKSLDASSGAAGRALWERFDAACEAAYAPVADHSRKLAQERQQNAAKAEAIIVEMRQTMETYCEGNDLRQVASVRRAAQQNWERLGHMDRKVRKRLARDFDAAMHALTEPLRAQWQVEIENRKRLIQDAERIGASERNAADRIRALQARWQQSAKALPLERDEEQSLWRLFRAACDAVYAQRKAATAAADAQRKRNADECAAICARLEADMAGDVAEIRRRIADAEAARGRVGPVPRASEKALEARYRKAIAALRARMESARKSEKQSQQRALLQKLDLCEEAEAALVEGRPVDLAWMTKWDGLPSLPPAFERPMRARFDAARQAQDSGKAARIELLKSNRTRLERDLLRMEIQSGIESPAEWAQQKRQLQIEALRSSLSGRRAGEPPVRLEDLCGLPALTDEPLTERLRVLLKKA